MTTPYSIRPASLDDVGFLTDVSIEATRAQGRLPEDFDESEWRTGFGEWSAEVLHGTSVIELDGRRIGRLRISRLPEAIELNGIQLLPELQNRGIGTAIITALQSEAEAAGIPLDLGVEKDNPNARRLYERLGFTKIGEDDREDKLRWRP
jgi:ribosomal protein S18 acetylase RimI-like enzyme